MKKSASTRNIARVKYAIERRVFWLDHATKKGDQRGIRFWEESISEAQRELARLEAAARKEG